MNSNSADAYPLPTQGPQYAETHKHWGKPDERYDRHFEVLYRIQRALVGHVSFLAAVESNAAFSELLLYEPILRVLMIQDYTVRTQVRCETRPPGSRGPSPTIDFVATHKELGELALEVKWRRRANRQKDEESIEAEERARQKSEPLRKLDIGSDTEKLDRHIGNAKTEGRKVEGFLCVFGRWRHIGMEKPVLLDKFDPYYLAEEVIPIVADLGRTRFACRIFQRGPVRLPAAEAGTEEEEAEEALIAAGRE